MKKLSEIADQIVDDGKHDGPKLVNVDIQVRSGGGIVPPSWSNSMRKLRDDEPKTETRRAPKERYES